MVIGISFWEEQVNPTEFSEEICTKFVAWAYMIDDGIEVGNYGSSWNNPDTLADL